MPKWTHVVEMTFEIELVDGTRIGGAGGGMEIGGVDPNLTALKDPVSGQPYIPGSSLKGKLRSTLEREHGRVDREGPCRCGSRDCPVCPIFGAHMNTRPECGSGRLMVRDCRFTADYKEVWKSRVKEGLPLFETKTENTIDRNRGTATNPRTQERVPAGAQFQGEMILRVFEGDKETGWVSSLKNALGILQRFDSLGAGGSRGSGRIMIRNFKEEKVALASIAL